MRVAYVMHADPGTVAPDDTFDRWPTAGRTVAALAATGAVEVVGVASTNGAAVDLVRDGARWCFVRPDGRLDRRVGWTVAGRVAALRPDVVHVNGIVAALATLALRLRCGRRPRLVVQHHGELPPRRRRTRWAQRWAERGVDGYLFTGAAGQARAWRDAGVIRRRTPTFEVLESSADVIAPPPGEARRATSTVGDPAVLWVGRMSAGKDPLACLRIFEALLAVRPLATLTMVFGAAGGNPAIEAQVREEAAHVGSNGAVRLVGGVPHGEIGAWFGAADVVISTSHHEGSGYSVIEALHCGCPVALSTIDSHRSIGGELAALFDVGDVAGGVQAVCRALTVERSAIAADAEQRLSWSAVAAQLLAAYGATDHSPPTSTGGSHTGRGG